MQTEHQGEWTTPCGYWCMRYFHLINTLCHFLPQRTRCSTGKFLCSLYLVKWWSFSVSTGDHPATSQFNLVVHVVANGQYVPQDIGIDCGESFRNSILQKHRTAPAQIQSWAECMYHCSVASLYHGTDKSYNRSSTDLSCETGDMPVPRFNLGIVHVPCFEGKVCTTGP